MKKILSTALGMVLMFSFGAAGANAATDAELKAAMDKTSKFMIETVKDPQVGSIGGEWAVIGLARSGYDVPQAYWDNYYDTVEEYVDDLDGVLHRKKYTEYSRLIVALSAIGADVTDVAGYDLTLALGDYKRTIWQGLNGPIWALIALDCGNYEIPVNPDAEIQATRQMYIDRILECELTEGGWNLFGGTNATTKNQAADPDITGMALQALAKYQDQPAVKASCDKAIARMEAMQNGQGGFSSWGTNNVESVVQIVVGATELGMDIDENFVKGDTTLIDNILTFQKEDGSFLHTADGSGDNQMSSEQAYYGMIAAYRADNDMSSLYQMDDVTISVGGEEAPAVTEDKTGLEGKNADVKAMPVVNANVSFPDIAGNSYETAILDLASRSIINGDADGNFYPANTMTRAEFATIVVKALGLTPATIEQFGDVATSAWYAPYIGTAYSYGIIKGTSDTTFEPEGKITRQDAAVMVARAAALCGMDTKYDTMSFRDITAGFMDYVKVAEYAQGGVAFAYDNDILDNSAMEIKPTENILRGEIAQMLYVMLVAAALK